MHVSVLNTNNINEFKDLLDEEYKPEPQKKVDHMVEFISHLKRSKHHIKKIYNITIDSFKNIAPRLDN